MQESRQGEGPGPVGTGMHVTEQLCPSLDTCGGTLLQSGVLHVLAFCLAELFETCKASIAGHRHGSNLAGCCCDLYCKARVPPRPFPASLSLLCSDPPVPFLSTFTDMQYLRVHVSIIIFCGVPPSLCRGK